MSECRWSRDRRCSRYAVGESDLAASGVFSRRHACSPVFQSYPRHRARRPATEPRTHPTILSRHAQRSPSSPLWGGGRRWGGAARFEMAVARNHPATPTAPLTRPSPHKGERGENSRHSSRSYTRRHVEPCGPSMISMPSAASDLRIWSAAAKSFALRASMRCWTSASMRRASSASPRA